MDIQNDLERLTKPTTSMEQNHFSNLTVA